MSRHAFWVILAGKTATSFKAGTREALLPTFRQLQRTQDDVSLRWFEHGKLWESPDAARASILLARNPDEPSRNSAWRPGGTHEDPRAKYEQTRDQKRASFKRRAISQNGPPREGRPSSAARPRATRPAGPKRRP